MNPLAHRPFCKMNGIGNEIIVLDLRGSQLAVRPADARTIGAQIPVRIVRRDRFGGLQAVDTHGVLLEFGADADLPAKLALVEPIRRSAGGRPLRAIDLRAPATPVIEFP